MSRTLFEITDDMRALDDLITEAGGDITDPAVEEAFNAFWDENNKHMTEKVEAYCWLIREQESRAAARKQEAERMSRRAQIDMNSARSLKQRLVAALQVANVKRMETDNFKVWWQANGGKAPLILDEEKVPEGYIKMREVREPNKDLIRQHLADGVQLEFAQLGERGNSLRMG